MSVRVYRAYLVGVFAGHQVGIIVSCLCTLVFEYVLFVIVTGRAVYAVFGGALNFGPCQSYAVRAAGRIGPGNLGRGKDAGSAGGQFDHPRWRHGAFGFSFVGADKIVIRRIGRDRFSRIGILGPADAAAQGDLRGRPFGAVDVVPVGLRNLVPGNSDGSVVPVFRGPHIFGRGKGYGPSAYAAAETAIGGYFAGKDTRRAQNKKRRACFCD